MPQTSTRLAQPEDIPVLALFERELARCNFPENPIEDLDYHASRLRKGLVREPEGMVVLVAPETQEILAWLWVITKRTLATAEQYGVIRSLYVRASARNGGLGTMLAEYARSFLHERGIIRAVATVHTGNILAVRTLEKAGFAPIQSVLEWRGR